MTKIYCDKCGGEITDNEYHFSARVGPRENMAQVRTQIEAALCEKCAEEIVAWFPDYAYSRIDLRGT